MGTAVNHTTDNIKTIDNVHIKELVSDLNLKQKEAVLKIDGPCLVLAGAGTGKTKTLMSRMAYIILSGAAKHYEILSLTFTNKAAKAMTEKLSELLKNHEPLGRLWLGTFHSICVRLLRAHSQEVGLSYDFAILNKDDQQRLVKKILKEQNIDHKQLDHNFFIAQIEKWKNKALSVTDTKDLDNDVSNFDLCHKVYQIYEQKLQEMDAIDFSGLIFQTIKLFRANAEILNYYKQQFRYIMVDEYQDINVAQYLLLKILCNKSSNICCVGDEDQSIYSWRGAEVSNILSFHKLFNNATIIRLEQNYRSTPNILEAATSLISNNEYRLGKKLWIDSDKNGEDIKVVALYNCQMEATFIARTILDINPVSFAETAILLRTSHLSRQLEEKLLTFNIPYQVIGGQKFYDRMEILDAISYARLCKNSNDTLALERIINVPKRNVGLSSLQILHEVSQNQKISLFQAISFALENNLIKIKKAAENLANLLNIINKYNTLNRASDAPKPGNLLNSLLTDVGYIDMWLSKEDGANRIDNLKELINSMRSFESINEFLEHISLVHEHSSNEFQEKNDVLNRHGKISIMTLHGAKGLEFNDIFLSGWEEEVFPNQRAVSQSALGLEEERRLAYVGITRAKKRLYITYAKNRFLHGYWQQQTASRFVNEIGKNNILFFENL